MPLRPQPRKVSNLIKLGKDNFKEMLSNLPQPDNRIKTLIFLEINLWHLLFNQMPNLHQRQWSKEITELSKVQLSLHLTLDLPLPQEAPFNTKAQSGRAQSSLAQLKTSQPESASQKRELETRACGETRKSNGKRRNHLQQWWVKRKIPSHQNSTTLQLNKERPESSMERDTEWASHLLFQRRKSEKESLMSLITSQRTQGMRERDRTSNLVFLLIKMRMSRDLGKEITLMLDKDSNLHQTLDGILRLDLPSQTTQERLTHSRADNNSWPLMFSNKQTTLNMLL